MFQQFFKVSLLETVVVSFWAMFGKNWAVFCCQVTLAANENVEKERPNEASSNMKCQGYVIHLAYKGDDLHGANNKNAIQF